MPTNIVIGTMLKDSQFMNQTQSICEISERLNFLYGFRDDQVKTVGQVVQLNR